MKLYQVVVLIVSLNKVTSVLADTRVLPPHDPYLGARSLGMSGAFVSIADDESALFSNPAGIGREDGKASKSFLKGASFPNITVGGDRNPGTVVKPYLSLQEDTVEKNIKVLEELRSYETSYARGSMFPYFTLGRFQLGFLSDQVVEAYRSDYTTPQTSIYGGTYTQKVAILSRTQTGPVAGLSIQHSRLGISLGVSARLMSRKTMYEDIETSQADLTKSAQTFVDSTNKSNGLGVDAGALIVLGKVWEPTIGLSVRDIGHTQYKGGGYDEVDRMNVVAGMSLQPSFGKKTHWLGSSVSFEGHHLNDSRVQMKDKMRFGTELHIGDQDVTAPLSLRVGHNLRAISYGASLDLLLFKLDVASYGEVVDGDQGERIDRRYVARLSVDLRN